MKLSDIKGDQVLDVLAELIVPVTNIAMDEAAAAILKKQNFQRAKVELLLH